MIPKNIIRLSMILSIMLGGIFTSCTYDAVDTTLPNLNDDATVTFALNVPGTSVPGTRGLSEFDETNVETIDVLLFRESGSSRVYHDKVLGVSLDNSQSSTKSFTAVIPVKDYNNYDIAVIANGREEIISAGLVKGEAKSTALNKLVKTLPTGEKWNSNKIPMWGEALNVTVDAGTNLSGDNAVKMTRMISRIDVKLSKKAATGSDEATARGNSNFELVSVRLYNYSTKGTLVPDLENGWNAGNSSEKPAATKPNQPADGYGKALFGDGHQPLVYLAADQHASAQNLPDSLIRAIYTLEAPAGSAETLTTNTCLVIGGKYQGGEESFYRIDFVAKNDKSQQYEYINLLRNFCYIVNISKISGDGFTSPELAFHSRPVNIEAEILEWNDTNLNDVVFDGQNYLSATPNSFEFYRNARVAEKNYGDNILYVKTDYSTEVMGEKSGWYVEKIVDADDRNVAAGWLTLSPESGAPKQQYEHADEVKLIFGENTGLEMRSAIVIIAAGRLRYEVLVKQSTIPDIMLNIVNPDTNLPIKELIFNSPVGQNPQPQKFRVDWRPENADLKVMSAPVIADPFPTGVGAPENETIFDGNNGTGTITYTIQPQGFTAEQVNEKTGDPFLEKSSKVDFLVSNGVSYESESIFLRQIHYNLIAEHNGRYLLDGNTYTMNVRSNTAWRIKSITGSSGNGMQLLALKESDDLRVGTTGGYNISGEEITFTVSDDQVLWGSVEVTFESTDSPKKFEDKTFTLTFPLRKMKIMGIASSSNTYGYNVAEPGNSGISPHHMLTSANNFGLTATSTVFTHGFEFLSRTASATDTRVKEWLAEKPDIIVLAFNTDISAYQATLFADYVKSGGVLIALYEYDESKDIIDAVFSTTGTTRTTAGGAGTNHLITDAIDDVITNGPFGDIRGQYWGEDASPTEAVSIPEGAIVYSTSGSNATALRHPELGFMFIGDGGFCSSNTSTSTGVTACPFKLDEEKVPTYRYRYGLLDKDAYNSQMFANIISWAMTQTTINDNLQPDPEI